LKSLRLLLPLLLLPLLLGCSVKRGIVGVVTPGLDPFVEALFCESDLDIAKSAFETNIQMIDGLRRMGDNARLQELHAMAMTGYALIFVEATSVTRASALYLRARDVGLILLGTDPFAMNENDFSIWLEGIGPKNAPGLFWTAFSYGGWMNLNLNHPDALFFLPRVEAMVQRSLHLEEDAFFAVGHLFLGALDCTRPRFVGGNPAAGLEHFQRAASLADPNLLLSRLFDLRYYCPSTLDETRFDELMSEIESGEEGLPESRLMNAWCKREALRLKAMRDDLF
jgi:hypothetical protein